MARPKKQTVDYFPHQCTAGKTMFILEQEFGNDGYAFWFKLLELLGTSEGHYIDCNNSVQLRFLQAKTRTDGETTIRILDMLSELGAIDQELWECKVIWCDNFINGILPVYQNRRVEIPTRPSFYIQKPEQDEVSTTDNPQSRVEYSRVEITPTPLEKISDTCGGLEAKQLQEEVKRLKEELKKAKRKGSAEKKREVSLPFKSVEFNEAWQKWLNYRNKEHNFKYKSSESEEAALDSLMQKSGNQEKIAIKIIEQSIAQTWKGFFKLKQENDTHQRNHQGVNGRYHTQQHYQKGNW